MKTLLLSFFMSAIALADPLIPQELVDQSQKEADSFKEKAYQFIEGLTVPQQKTSNACSSCQDKGFLKQQSLDASEKKGEQKLLIFVSSSLPKESLKSLFLQAQEIGATLVFRGLIKDSFKKTKEYFEALQINAEVNPPLFEEYQITQVPTFLLRDGEIYDSVQGNLSLEEALILMKNKGDLKVQAKVLLAEIKGAQQ